MRLLAKSQTAQNHSTHQQDSDVWIAWLFDWLHKPAELPGCRYCFERRILQNQLRLHQAARHACVELEYFASDFFPDGRFVVGDADL